MSAGRDQACTGEDFTTVSLYAALTDIGIAGARATERIGPDLLGPCVRYLDELTVARCLSATASPALDTTAIVTDHATILGSKMEIRAGRAVIRLVLGWEATN